MSGYQVEATKYTNLKGLLLKLVIENFYENYGHTMDSQVFKDGDE